MIFVDAVSEEFEAPKVMKVESKGLSTEELAIIASSIDPHDVAPSTLALIALASGTLKGDCYIIGVPIESLELGFRVSQKALNGALASLKYVELLLEKYGCKVELNKACIEKEIEESCRNQSIAI